MKVFNDIRFLRSPRKQHFSHFSLVFFPVCLLSAYDLCANMQAKIVFIFFAFENVNAAQKWQKLSLSSAKYDQTEGENEHTHTHTNTPNKHRFLCI